MYCALNVKENIVMVFKRIKLIDFASFYWERVTSDTVGERME